MDIGFYRYSFRNRGGDRVVIDYANHLATEGHRVTFHTCGMQTIFTIHPDITIHMLPARNEITFLLYPLWHRLPHDLVLFDIIHCAPSLTPLHRQGMVYLAQADDVEYYGNRLARTAIDGLYQWFFRQRIPTITVSEELTATFRRRYDASRCQTVPNGINLGTFYPDPDAALVQSKADRIAIFFMARGDRFRKGFDIAFKVFTTLDKTVHDAMELWVCGEKFDADLPFPVRQFGVVNDKRLRQILSSADIFFYPSRHEGFGLFPLEAMACGCVPVITDAIPYHAVANCLQVAPVGDIAALQQLLMRLLENPTYLTALREQAKTVATHFDLQDSKELFCRTLGKINEGGRL